MIFNNNGNVFEQIANNYIKLIKSGVIKNGEYLPSCRDLAKELGINPNTVQKAYTMLEEEGFVTKVLKKGVYVSYLENNDPLKDFKDYAKKLNDDGFSKQELKDAIDLAIGGEEN
jgi:GntR family transcriptional regulator